MWGLLKSPAPILVAIVRWVAFGIQETLFLPPIKTPTSMQTMAETGSNRLDLMADEFYMVGDIYWDGRVTGGVSTDRLNITGTTLIQMTGDIAACCFGPSTAEVGTVAGVAGR